MTKNMASYIFVMIANTVHKMKKAALQRHNVNK